jgi:hypothetical protein
VFPRYALFVGVSRFLIVSVVSFHLLPLCRFGPSLGISLSGLTVDISVCVQVTLAGERAVSRGSASFLRSAATDGGLWLIANNAQEYEV